jgi:hypothetical protein
VFANAWETIFYSCELQASLVNETLKLWIDMGGMKINSGVVIVQVVHKTLFEPIGVINVHLIWPPICTSHNFCTTWSSFDSYELWSCFVILEPYTWFWDVHNRLGKSMACFDGMWEHSAPSTINYMACSSVLFCGCSYIVYHYPPQCGCAFCHPLLLHPRYEWLKP